MSSITSKSYPTVTVSKDGDLFAIVRNGQLMKMNRQALTDYINQLAPNTLIALSDTPGSYVGQQGKGLVVNSTEDGMEFAPTVSSNFLALTDTPGTYGGQAGRLPVVNSGETALEFIDNFFIKLGDTPAAYTGASEQIVRVNTGATGVEFVPPAQIQTSGWAQYSDTVYTSGSPFSVVGGVDTVVPNNAGAVIDSQKPTDVVTFYDGAVITGRNGDDIIITIDMVAVPTSAGTTTIEFWFDIGGSIGELYRQILTFPKGVGVMRPINFTVLGYTLDTWETNGATVYVRTNDACDLYNIRYVISRNHKAK